jgi:hypothetical protein
MQIMHTGELLILCTISFIYILSGAATFTGSHVQYGDYDREMLSYFMEHKDSAAKMIKGFGEVIKYSVNLAGDYVGPRNPDGPTKKGAHYSNTDADGNYVVANGAPTRADWLMQSLCSGWLTERHMYGRGIGNEDRVFMTNEEWITLDPTNGGPDGFVGLSAHAIDIANGVDYAVGAVTNSGFEKIVEFNSGHKDYVAWAVSGECSSP